MAVEIKEILVKAIIANNRNNAEEFNTQEEFSRKQVKEHQSDDSSQQALIQSCVDQVLKVLQKRSLR